jgi:16S rRNA (cytosine967-C5)-methyltransferase
MAASHRHQGHQSATARALATDLVNTVLLHGQSLTTALEDARPTSERRQLAAAQDLSYEALRRCGRLRFFLRHLADRPLQPPDLLGLLLVALAELDRGETPAYAAVNEAVSLAGTRHPRARSFVNALLRNFLRRRAELIQESLQDVEARWNFPPWWIDRLRDQYPEDWSAILTTMNAHPPMTLRVNRRRATLPEYLALLEEAGMQAKQTGEWALTLAKPVRVSELPGFAEGVVSVQDVGAQYAAPLLECADGMRVLDACAAPGGKTAQLLEGHQLDLTALDVDHDRLDRVRANLARLGLSARLKTGDAGHAAGWWDGRPFDRILLDAPCTASGVARRHPDSKWLKRCEDVTALAKQQARLLDAVWPLLEQGGKLLFATCSLFREENGDQIEAFLRRHADARQEPVNLPDARQGQLLPDREHDGFFYARIVKA